LRTIFLSSVLTLFSWSSFAQEACGFPWIVKSVQVSSSSLNLVLQEYGQVGPACHLVVKSFDYIDGLEALSLQIAPAKICPLDAVKAREANLNWQLPFELRESGRLKLVVNGVRLGTVALTGDVVTFVGVGGCR
jgi:hypothetical protein